MAVRQGKILVIDDNEDILFTLKMLLRPLAESVTICTNPKEINRLVSTTKYNVILLDMNFTADAVSGKEGFYWLERIREISPETVVILITAYSDTEKAVRAIKAGATDFIPKPEREDAGNHLVGTRTQPAARRSADAERTEVRPHHDGTGAGSDRRISRHGKDIQDGRKVEERGCQHSFAGRKRDGKRPDRLYAP